MDIQTQSVKINSLEALLVKQFRTLESLITISKKERELILDHRTEELMKVVEQKESVLDQLGLMEEDRRMLTEELAAMLGLKLQRAGLDEILTVLESAIADRFYRLNEGILALVDQARELNIGNQAMARSAIEWLEATQLFLLNVSAPEVAYSYPGANRKVDTWATRAIDQRV